MNHRHEMTHITLDYIIHVRIVMGVDFIYSDVRDYQ